MSGQSLKKIIALALAYAMAIYASYGDAPTRDVAMAAFRAEYKRWVEQQPKR